MNYVVPFLSCAVLVSSFPYNFILVKSHMLQFNWYVVVVVELMGEEVLDASKL